MWLRLNLRGFEINIQIKGYAQAAKKDRDSAWCGADYSFSSFPWLDYSNQDDEVFLASEIDDLIRALGALLAGRITKQQEFICVNSEFTFILRPKMDIRDNPRYLYVPPDAERILDVSVEWQALLWEEGFVADELTMNLEREDIECFLTYLRLVAGKIKKDDPAVVQLMQKNILYEAD